MLQFKKYMILLVGLFISLSTYAGEETYLQRLEGVNVLQGSVLTIVDGQYTFMQTNGGSTTNATWKNTFGIKQTKAYFELGHDEFLQTQLLLDYALEFSIRITPFDLDGNPVGNPIDRILKVDYSGNSGLNIHRDVAVIDNYHHLNVEIVSITDPQGLPVLAPENLYFEGRLEVERYYAFNPLAQISASGLSHTTTDLDANSTPDQIQLNWSFLQGAESYEIEWSHINNYTKSGGAAAANSLALTAYDFEHNSTRVRVKENFYKINLVYDQGFIVYRVRGLGIGGNDFDKEIFGLWSSDNGSTKVSVQNWPNRYEITASSAHEKSLNWKYSATYAEGGKRKEAVVYADGTTRTRQEITKLNSINKTAVGEQIYDFEGRSAIQIMMTPTDESVLKYFPNHNLNHGASPKPYSRLDFDLDVSGCIVNTESMSTQSGSSKYYSNQAGAAPVTRPWQDYVPDAEGYPFIQTEYTPDNTGRIRSQGQAGATHQLGTGHETKMFYAQPNQEELDRLFGYNVGYKSRYQKNATVDPNGQVSVNYVAPDGKTIATALAGEAPANLQALPSNTASGIMTIDLLGKINFSDTDTEADDNLKFNTGLIGANNDGLEASTSHLVVQNQSNLTLNYHVVPPVYEAKCDPVAKLEMPIAYNLKIDAKDQCGKSVLDGGVITTTGIEYGGITAFNDIASNLSIGQYQISKQLTVDKVSLEQNKSDYIAYMQDNGCVKTLQDYQDHFLALLDTTGCYETCETCLEDLMLDGAGIIVSGTETESDWMAYYSNLVISTYYTQVQWIQGYRDCMEACNGYLSPCEAMKEVMLADVKPGGQYGLVMNSQGNIDPTRHSLSVFNTSSTNLLGGNFTGVTFLDEDGLTTHTFGSNEASKLILEWQDQWAEQLLHLHPEYCYLEWCYAADEPFTAAPNGVSSNRFNHDIVNIDNSTDLQTYFTGVSGLTNPSNAIFAADPFFNSGYNSTMASTFTFQIGPVPAVQLMYHDIAFNVMKDRLDNYQTAGESMWDFVVAGIRTRGWYGISPTPLSFGAPEYKRAWNMFKFLYLSEKQKIEQDLAGFYAIENGCYNGCIGDFIPGFPMAHGFVNQFVDLINAQPCNIVNMQAYLDKERRFVIPEAMVDLSGDPNDVIQRLENSGDYQLYLNTGQCPNDFDFEFLLNGLIVNNQLTSTLPLQGIPEFTIQLYRNISGLDPTVDIYEQYSWKPTIATNTTQLNVVFTTPSGTPRFAGNVQGCLGNQSLFQLNIQNNGFQPAVLNWNGYGTMWEIERFQDLSSTSGSPSSFSVLAKVVFTSGPNSGARMEVVISGQTCVALGGCGTVNSTDPNALNNGVNAQNGFANPCPSNELLDGVIYIYKQYLIDGASNPINRPINYDVVLTDLGNYLGAYGSDDIVWDQGGNVNQFRITNVVTNRTIFVNINTIPSGGVIPPFNTILGTYPISDQLAEMEVEYLALNGNNIPTVRGQKLQISLTDRLGNPLTLTDCCQLPNYSQQAITTQFIPNGDFEQGNVSFTTGYNYFNGTGILPVDQFTITNNLSSVASSNLINCSDDHTPYGVNALVAYNKSDNTITAYEVNNVNLVVGKTYDLSFWWNILWQAGAPNADNGLIQYKIYINGNGLTHQVSPLSQFCSWNEAILSFTASQVSNTIRIVMWGGHQTQPGTIFALDDISIEETNEVCLPCITEAPLTLDCYTEYNAYQAYLTSIKASIPSLFIMSEEEFCAGTYKYYNADYLAYLQGLYGTIGNDLFVSDSAYYLNWPQLITDNYGPFIPHYLNYVAGLGYPNLRDLGYLSLSQFASYGISAQAVTDYLVALANSNLTQLGGIVPFSGGYEQLNPCPKFHKVDPPTLVLPDPCVMYLTNVAMLNAQTQYDLYINGISESFENDYLAFALDEVVEQFTMEYEDKEYHYTLYEYDQAGNLVRTVPPAGVDRLDLSLSVGTQNLGELIRQQRKLANTAYISNLLPKHKMVTQYQYNTLNQLVWQETPDGGVSRFWYDDLGRIVASQDEAQFPVNYYSFTNYDALGRLKQSGQFTFGGTLIDALLNPITNDYPFNFIGLANNIIQDFREVTYSSESNTNVLAQFSEGQNNLRNRVASQAYYEEYDLLQNKEYQLTSANHFSYDIHGNVVEYLTENSIMPAAHRYKLIRNEYDLVGGLVNEYAYQPGKSDAFYHEYEYDDDLRLTNVHTSTDQVNWQQDAKYFYYDHGPQARKELGEYKVQAIDKVYTINGWIKAFNSNALADGNDMGNDGFTANSTVANTGVNAFVGSDVYGTSEHYFVGDYASRTGINDQFLSNVDAVVNPLLAQPYSLYNGNIGMEAVVIKDMNETAIDPIAKTFKYDQLNRIKAMNPYLNHTGTMDYAGITNQGGEYQAAYSYDPNGNLLTLNRNAQDLSGSTAMDDLTYWYYKKDGTTYNPQTGPIPANATNRLAYVSDAEGNTRGDDFTGYTGIGVNYEYYADGNLKSDADEEIASINWTIDNKVKSITRTAGSNKPNIEYTYDFTGERIAKIVKVKPTDPNFNVITHYAKNSIGDLMATYHENKGQYLVGAEPRTPNFRTEEHYIYGSGRIAVTNEWKKEDNVIVNQDGFGIQTNSIALSTKKYQLSNLRSDVVTTVDAKKLTALNVTTLTLTQEPDVLYYNDYYPFGMDMVARKGSSDGYRFGFNGMEKNLESQDSYTTHYRQLDVRIGRWISIDPLADEFSDQSPYNLSFNSPTYLLDKTGASPTGPPGGNPMSYIMEGFRQYFQGVGQSIDNARVTVFGKSEKTIQSHEDKIGNVTVKVETKVKVEKGYTVGTNLASYFDNSAGHNTPPTDIVPFEIGYYEKASIDLETSISVKRGVTLTVKNTHSTSGNGGLTQKNELSAKVGSSNASASIYVNKSDKYANGKLQSSSAKVGLKGELSAKSGATKFTVGVKAEYKIYDFTPNSPTNNYNRSQKKSTTTSPTTPSKSSAPVYPNGYNKYRNNVTF